MNLDGLTFLTASDVLNQLVHLNHSNEYSDCFIVACFRRVQSMLTTLLFAQEVKFVLKIEIILRREYNGFFSLKQTKKP